MKIRETTSKVERSGEFKETTFKIKASAKAFDILSSRLYTNVPLAIVRELSTNAWDAHVEAKTTSTPFKVHLPNNTEPYFNIRDFGTGLSLKQIQNLYTTYFDSDKTDSNEFTGALGLGSKSPFAYGDSFTVTSYYKKTKFVFSMFKNEQGLPTVALMNQEKTKEPNGLEVQLAVKREDFKAFTDVAQQLYPYFPRTPSISGAKINLKLALRKPILEGKGWRLFEPEKTRYSYYYADTPGNRSVAIMGNIAYPIQKEQFKTEPYRALVHTPLYLYFDIGDLEMAANREELHYSDFTTKAMKKKLDRVLKGLKDELQKKISACESLWDAKSTANDLVGGKASGVLHELKGVLTGADLSWKGKKFSVGNIDVGGLKGEIRSYRVGKGQQYNYSTSSYNHVVREEKGINWITPALTARFVVDDLNVGAISRVRKYLRDKYDKDTEETKKLTVYLFKPEELGSTATFQKKLGIQSDSIIRAETLEAPARATRAKRSKTPGAKVLKFKSVASGPPSNAWENATIQPEDGGVYVPVMRFKIDTDKVSVPSGVSPSPWGIKDLLTLLTAIDAAPGNVYGIRSGALDAVLKKGEWTDLLTHAKKKWTDYVEKEDLATTISRRRGLSSLSSKWKWYRSIHTQIKSPVKGSSFVAFAETVALAAKANDKLDNVIKLGNQLGMPMEAADLGKMEAKVLKKYPIVQLIGSKYYWHSNKNEETVLANYVSLVDRNEKSSG